MLYFTILVVGVYLNLSVPTVVSASIHNQVLIRSKRENEIFDENFLSGHSVQLPVPAKAQTLQFTCGPTVVSSILQFFGYRSSATDISGNISGNLCTDHLIVDMWTEPYSPAGGGTQINDFINTLNRYIDRGNLNNLRHYSAILLNPSNFNQNGRIDYTTRFWILAREIYNSLVNRAPAILAFRGRFSGFEERRNHFILISGIRITSNGATFSYMDPDGGVQRSFEHHQLNHLLEDGGYLVHHSPVRAAGSISPNMNCGVSEAVGGSAGLTGGLVSGAIVGSTVPGIGTFFGGLVGAVVGLIVGAVTGGVACAS